MEELEPVVDDGAEGVVATGGPSPGVRNPPSASADADSGFDVVPADIKTATDEDLSATSEPVVIGSLS